MKLLIRSQTQICNTRYGSTSAVRCLNAGGTVYPKKYAHGFFFAVLCCGYTLTDFPISIRLTSLALRQSNDCPSASKATLMNMDKYFMWIHYERLRNHKKAKHNKTVCIFLGIYCSWWGPSLPISPHAGAPCEQVFWNLVQILVMSPIRAMLHLFFKDYDNVKLFRTWLWWCVVCASQGSPQSFTMNGLL